MISNLKTMASPMSTLKTLATGLITGALTPAGAAAALAVPVLVILAKAAYKKITKYKQNQSAQDMLNEGTSFNAEAIAKRILEENIQDDTDDNDNKWASYIIANKLLTKTATDEAIRGKAEEVKKALDTLILSEKQKLEAEKFDAKKAVEFWQVHGKNSTTVLKALTNKHALETEAKLGIETYAWMIYLSHNQLFEQVFDGNVSSDDPLIILVKTKLKEQFDKSVPKRVIATIQDNKGGRVDFSANPKAVFAPPRDARDANPGTLDLGVLGDAYICVLSSLYRHKWILLPSCLQRFAYQAIFKTLTEKEQPILRNPRAVLF